MKYAESFGLPYFEIVICSYQNFANPLSKTEINKQLGTRSIVVPLGDSGSHFVLLFGSMMGYFNGEKNDRRTIVRFL